MAQTNNKTTTISINDDDDDIEYNMNKHNKIVNEFYKIVAPNMTAWLRDQYEKKIAEMKDRHADEIRKIREEYEKRIKDDSNRH